MSHQAKARYKRLLRGLVASPIENGEPLEWIRDAFLEVADEIKAQTDRSKGS